MTPLATPLARTSTAVTHGDQIDGVDSLGSVGTRRFAIRLGYLTVQATWTGPDADTLTLAELRESASDALRLAPLTESDPP